MFRRVLTVLAASGLGLVGIGALPASAAPPGLPPGDIAVFPVATGFGGGDVAAGPDGNLWYTVPGRNQVGVATTAGTRLAAYGVPGSAASIVAGPDDALWFDLEDYSAGQAAVGEITTSGTVAVFPLPAADGPVDGLAAGPDGNLWFTVPAQGSDNGFVGEMTPRGVVSQYPLPVAFQGGAHDIAAGPGGDLWFVGQTGGSAQQSAVGRVTTSGHVTMYPLPAGDAGPGGVTAGPDGDLWFLENHSTLGQPVAGHIGASGAVGFVPLAGVSGVTDIAAGPDGNLYVTAQENPPGSDVGAIVGLTAGGVETVYPEFPNDAPQAITGASDGDLWFTGGALAGLGKLTISRPDAVGISMASTVSPAVFGQSGSLTATLTPAFAGAPAPTGTVTFVYGSAPYPTVPVVDGVATVSLSTLPIDLSEVSALYNGDENYGPASYEYFQQQIGRAGTTTTVTSSANPAASGQDVTVTAAVAPVAPGGGVPTGSLAFDVDGMSQTVPLQDGAATLNLSSLDVGAHSISASYTPADAGDAAQQYDPSSGTLAQTVDRNPGDGCPCSAFPLSSAPGSTDSGDPSAVELGVKVRSAVAGNITGVRFYKGAQNTGTHTGSLWSADGALLATGTFTGETATGWQTLTFAAPVPIKANTTYIASYHAPSGHYSYDGGYFAASGTGGAPVTALQDGADGANGVFAYGLSSAFPSDSYGAANYWVDAVLDTAGVPTAGPSVVATTPADGSGSAASTTSVSATFSAPLDAGTLRFSLSDVAPGGGQVPGTVSYDPATRTATFTPATQLPLGTAVMASVQASDVWGHASGQPDIFEFAVGTTPPAYACPCSLFPAGATPAVPNSGDANSVELGTRFTPEVSGTVTGIRFYKGSLNTGTHTGSLWSAAGTLLATGTFTGESTTGWQTLTFATPVPVTAGTTYVASYHAPNGDYSYTSGYFDFPRTNYPLTAPASTATAGNGMYGYGDSTAFPGSLSAGTDYWVDAVFLPA